METEIIEEEKRAQKIFDVASMLLPIFILEHKNELGDKKGLQLGLLKIKQEKGVNPRSKVRSNLIGKIPREKLIEKLGFATEKVVRLYLINDTRESLDNTNFELSSFDSENIENGQFGGGIMGTYFYGSASNFPPHLDQKFMLQVFLITNEITFGAAAFIDIQTKEKQQYWIERSKQAQTS